MINKNRRFSIYTHRHYINKSGAIDSFNQTSASGNGSVTSDLVNREIDLATGVGDTGSAKFTSKKTWKLSGSHIKVDFIVNNIINGTSVSMWNQIGLSTNFNSVLVGKAVFECDNAGNWYITTETNAFLSTQVGITAIANNDKLTILAKSTSISFYVNDVLIQTITTTLPSTSAELYIGSSIVYGGAPTVSRSISVSSMSIKS